MHSTKLQSLPYLLDKVRERIVSNTYMPIKKINTAQKCKNLTKHEHCSWCCKCCGVVLSCSLELATMVFFTYVHVEDSLMLTFVDELSGNRRLLN